MVGGRISERRRRLGIKQADLAAAMGVNQSMVSMIETGQHTPSFTRAAHAARVLRTSLDYLAGLTDDPRPAEDMSRMLTEIERNTIPMAGLAAAGNPMIDGDAPRSRVRQEDGR